MTGQHKKAAAALINYLPINHNDDFFLLLLEVITLLRNTCEMSLECINYKGNSILDYYRHLLSSSMVTPKYAVKNQAIINNAPQHLEKVSSRKSFKMSEAGGKH